jgi:ribonucleoside-diphosphate reductase alpha chain
VYEGETSPEAFNREWENLVASGSGERGIFNRTAAQKQASRNWMRDNDVDYGTNPCAEIILRPKSFCNLSEVIVREDDTFETLKRKVELATILGTWQSTLDDFPFLRPEWSENAREERLLGVSLTGVFGNELMFGAGKEKALSRLNRYARIANDFEARMIGINRSVAICTQKPSGTVSQLAGVSSGGHPWYAQYYVRTVRADRKDPLAQLMIDARVPHEPDVTQPDTTLVFSFPIKAPYGAVTREDLTAIEHLEHWLAYKTYWCDHTPSVTISVRPEEWDAVRQWVWEHLDEITGVSFLPYSEHTYKQAPYQEISAAEWRAMALSFPEVRWADLSFYELADSTTGSATLACSASGCDSADLVPA